MKILKDTGDSILTALLSYDEKPGIQEKGNIYPDKPPDADHVYIYRNHDYVRHGTLFLMVGMGLFR